MIFSVFDKILTFFNLDFLFLETLKMYDVEDKFPVHMLDYLQDYFKLKVSF